MPQDPDQIKHEIAVEREHLQQHLFELHDKVEEAKDWHTYVPRNPLWIPAAIAAGGLVFVLTSRRS